MRLRKPFVVVLAFAPACSTATSDAVNDASVESAAGDASPDSGAPCPAIGSTCADAGTLYCGPDRPYSDNRTCVGGAWCRTFLNPPAPPAQPGECPLQPPVNGTPCVAVSALIDCPYECGAMTAHAICHEQIWCGVVPSTCTLVVDAGVDASDGGVD